MIQVGGGVEEGDGGGEIIKLSPTILIGNRGQKEKGGTRKKIETGLAGKGIKN